MDRVHHVGTEAVERLAEARLHLGVGVAFCGIAELQTMDDAEEADPLLPRLLDHRELGGVVAHRAEEDADLVAARRHLARDLARVDLGAGVRLGRESVDREEDPELRAVEDTGAIVGIAARPFVGICFVGFVNTREPGPPRRGAPPRRPPLPRRVVAESRPWERMPFPDRAADGEGAILGIRRGVPIPTFRRRGAGMGSRVASRRGDGRVGELPN